MSLPTSSPEKSETRKSKTLKIVVSCVLFILACAVMTYTRPDRQQSFAGAPQIWFYNLDSKKLERQPDRLAPITSPSGGTLVKAYVFSCGDCADSNARFIGWLDRFNDEAKNKLQNNSARAVVMYTGPQGLDSLPEGFFGGLIPPNSYQIRALEGDWIDAHSDAAEKIREQARGRCGEVSELNDCNAADFDPEATSSPSTLQPSTPTNSTESPASPGTTPPADASSQNEHE